MLRSQKAITLIAGKFMDMSVSNYANVSRSLFLNLNLSFYKVYLRFRCLLQKLIVLNLFYFEILKAAASYLSVLRTIGKKN